MYVSAEVCVWVEFVECVCVCGRCVSVEVRGVYGWSVCVKEKRNVTGSSQVFITPSSLSR